MNRVGILGIGHTVFGRRSDATVQELAFEAYREALADGDLDPEIIEATGGGRMCEPDDADSLADLLESMLSDEAGTRELGERGRAAVLERFHVDRMAKEFEDVLTMVTTR
jgi:glycosyltransferase involved in cell wall biosynthesis